MILSVEGWKERLEKRTVFDRNMEVCIWDFLSFPAWGRWATSGSIWLDCTRILSILTESRRIHYLLLQGV